MKYIVLDRRGDYGEVLDKQIDDVRKARGEGKLEELFAGDETWVVG